MVKTATGLLPLQVEGAVMTLLVFLGIVFAWLLFTEPHPVGRAASLTGRRLRPARPASVAARRSGILFPVEPRTAGTRLALRRGGRDG